MILEKSPPDATFLSKIINKNRFFHYWSPRVQQPRSSRPSYKKVNEHFLPIFQLGKSVTVEEKMEWEKKILCISKIPKRSKKLRYTVLQSTPYFLLWSLGLRRWGKSPYALQYQQSLTYLVKRLLSNAAGLSWAENSGRLELCTRIRTENIAKSCKQYILENFSLSKYFGRLNCKYIGPK